MALPIIAAGIAARAVAKKLATRAVAGITGAGAKNVAPINREMGTGSVKVISRGTKQYPDDFKVKRGGRERRTRSPRSQCLGAGTAQAEPSA